MDMPPTVNTVSTFPMAVPKLSPTTLPMPMEDMLLMSNTKVLLNTQKLSHTTQLSQPHTTPNCCTIIKLNVFIQNIYSINRINTEKKLLLSKKKKKKKKKKAYLEKKKKKKKKKK